MSDDGIGCDLALLSDGVSDQLERGDQFWRCGCWMGCKRRDERRVGGGLRGRHDNCQKGSRVGARDKLKG